MKDKSLKTYVLTVSKTFMKGHPKAGEPTNFCEKLKSGDKIHTIRGNCDFWKKRIREVAAGNAVLSIRQWTGKPYRSEQVEIARVTKDHKPGVQRVFITYSGHLGYEASVNTKELFGASEREALARNDGLDVWDFSDWFFQQGKKDQFSGIIIHFTEFRY